MLIFVSDLHLADHPGRGSFETEAFLRELAVQLDRRPERDAATLVLLGDIFELLKAGRWLITPHRPWHEHSPALEQTIVDVLEDVNENNRAFFEGLAALRASTRVQMLAP